MQCGLITSLNQFKITITITITGAVILQLTICQYPCSHTYATSNVPSDISSNNTSPCGTRCTTEVQLPAPVRHMPYICCCYLNGPLVFVL